MKKTLRCENATERLEVNRDITPLAARSISTHTHPMTPEKEKKIATISAAVSGVFLAVVLFFAARRGMDVPVSYAFFIAGVMGVADFYLMRFVLIASGRKR